MLPSRYKLKARNDAGVTCAVTVDWKPFKAPGGVLAYGTQVQPVNSPTLAAGSSASNGTAYDNTTDLMHGGHATLTVNPGSTPSGNKTVYLFLVGSSDNTTFGDEERQIGAITVSATGAVSAIFEVPI